MKKVVIAGGTGFIGSYLKARFEAEGYTVIIVARNKPNIRFIDQDKLVSALEGALLLINLAGKPINVRFTNANKRALIESRTLTTRQLGSAVNLCTHPPKLWINASGAHIYGTSDAHPHTEADGVDSNFFLAEMASKWEEAFFSFQRPETRQIAFRTCIVLGKNGGLAEPYFRLARLGLGGTQGNGKQKFSWIHIEDYFQIILFALEHETLTGPVNIGSPQPVNNEHLMRAIRKAVHAPFGLPAPAPLISVGTTIIGIEPALVLKSLWALPQKLTQAGYRFLFPDIESALADITKA